MRGHGTLWQCGTMLLDGQTMALVNMGAPTLLLVVSCVLLLVAMMATTGGTDGSVDDGRAEPDDPASRATPPLS